MSKKDFHPSAYWNLKRVRYFLHLEDNLVSNDISKPIYVYKLGYAFRIMVTYYDYAHNFFIQKVTLARHPSPITIRLGLVGTAHFTLTVNVGNRLICAVNTNHLSDLLYSHINRGRPNFFLREN